MSARGALDRFFGGTPVCTGFTACAAHPPRRRARSKAAVVTVLPTSVPDPLTNRPRGPVHATALSGRRSADAVTVHLQAQTGQHIQVAFQALAVRGQIVARHEGIGPSGEGYLRLTAFGEREDCIEAMRRIRMWI